MGAVTARSTPIWPISNRDRLCDAAPGGRRWHGRTDPKE